MDYILETLLPYMLEAFTIVLTPTNLIALVVATFAGLLMGMLPGLTATMAVALLTGLSFGMPTQTAIITILGIYVGSISGGCQSAILLNIPGTPASAATAQDGYAMGQQGKAGLAIFLATSASFLGTLLGTLCLLLFTPVLTQLALKFGSYEFFMLALFGIIICGNLTSGGNTLKGYISGFAGLLVAQIGMDTLDAYNRFTYGSVQLTAGIQLIPVMIGLFGFPEILGAFKEEHNRMLSMTAFHIKEGLSILKRNALNIVRSSILGVSVGIIPGVGEDVGGWLSYWAEKTTSKTPEKFGKGIPNGVISAETGNNACIGGAIIPVLTLAVPGSAPAAVLLAAFQLHGYRPGPLLMSETPDFLFKVCIYLIFSAIIMWILALVIARFTVKILSVTKELLMPIIYVLCIVGAFVIRGTLFDVKLMFIFGIIGFIMAKLRYPAAPFLLGVILGNMADANLRRGLNMSNGSLMPFFTRPICVIFLIIIIFLIISQTGLLKKSKNKTTAQTH